MALILIATSTLLIVFAFQLFKLCLQAYTSPLSAIPNAGAGAPYSRLLWAFPREYWGTITLDLPSLHKKLGPLIQIGPRELSFYSLDVYDTVHKVNSGFRKDPRVYGQFVQDGHPALFSITNSREHSNRRRMMGQLFNRSKMSKLESLMVHHIRLFADALVKKNKAIDINSACRALEADIISGFSFGNSLNAIDAWARGDGLAMVAKNDEKATRMPMLTTFPATCEAWEQFENLVYQMTGIRSLYRHALDEFDEWTKYAWGAAMEFTKPSRSIFPNLIQVLVNSGLHPETALSEAKENLGPGTDTTSGSLAHILFALGWNPLYQDALYQDLLEVEFSTEMTVLENIPRLRACVKEGIRWGGTAAAMLPRVVPEGGVELFGSQIPEGTILTSSPIWYLRDEKAFPMPELFDPYRWIEVDGSTFKDDSLRDQYYIPFSKGTNSCMGVHFSYYELYLSVSQLVRRFRFQSSDSEGGPVVCDPSTQWRLASLPARKEWVAAVLNKSLLVTFEERQPATQIDP
ncbi:benzoate 4-monooxygenase cytochrome p450 [Ilyonectria sp. MPI-CAGE-AT-0026]|nr:benzoate 4-monooxygenase cytochrome p450 [Ilyonectria sp. MPI-CAGE-AT-0026]